jgi:glycosyltransferase involved in cell wall biosynthesis
VGTDGAGNLEHLSAVRGEIVKIAFLGSRGIPARYSGFETFYEQLAVRLAQRGHQVTVYNRSHFIKDIRGSYQGVRIVRLPSIPTKHLDTLTHTALSSLHALFQGYDIAYYCIVGNSPLVWLPRMGGAKSLLNVDGQDWAREKWSGFARWYQRQCEWIAPHTASVLIADSHVIRERYQERYQAQTLFVPYGANIPNVEGRRTLDQWGLQPRDYILYVGRLVPENAIDLLIRAFRGLRTSKKLVIVGDAPFADDYKASLQALADDRVIFTGYAFGQEYAELSSQAYLYVQPSAIDGTRPAILDQMGFGNAILIRNSPANQEVVGDYGASFGGENVTLSLTNTLQDLIDHPDKVAILRRSIITRVQRYYNWEWITDFYEDLFQRMKKGLVPDDYDAFILKHYQAVKP